MITATATFCDTTVSLAAKVQSNGWAQYAEITGQALAGAARRLGIMDEWRHRVGLSQDNPHALKVEIHGCKTDGPPLRGGRGMVAWVE